MEIPIPGASDLVNPLASQFGHLSLQDKAFLDAFNRQEQQELHGVPRLVHSLAFLMPLSTVFFYYLLLFLRAAFSFRIEWKTKHTALQ